MLALRDAARTAATRALTAVQLSDGSEVHGLYRIYSLISGLSSLQQSAS